MAKLCNVLNFKFIMGCSEIFLLFLSEVFMHPCARSEWNIRPPNIENFFG